MPLVSGSRRVVRGDLLGTESVVIDRHFVDSPLKPLVVVTSVGADLNGMRCVKQKRNTRIGYRADRRAIDVISRTPPSDRGRWFVNEIYRGTPVPVRGTACGLAPPSSTIFRDACRSPLAPGVKVTSIVQLPPAASLDRHVVVSAKSPKFAPLMPTPEICKSSLPIFVTVAVRGSLVVPTT